jgi:hypothetical protein
MISLQNPASFGAGDGIIHLHLLKKNPTSLAP